ncbi:MAG: helix-turn-helix domain-containing protein [Planctomycetales bacterium]|nr:helix-turn-helix domain-containing protein [Planctomycetales bacterium]
MTTTYTTPAANTVPVRLLLTPREAAKAMAVSERTLWGWSEPRGPIPVVRIGRSVRYDQRDLIAFIDFAKTETHVGTSDVRSVEPDRPDDVTKGGQAR